MLSEVSLLLLLPGVQLKGVPESAASRAMRGLRNEDEAAAEMEL